MYLLLLGDRGHVIRRNLWGGRIGEERGGCGDSGEGRGGCGMRQEQTL